MREIVSIPLNQEKTYKEIYGTSGEQKPTEGLAMGSLYIEVDTGGTSYMFNETTSGWVKVGGESA